MNHIEIQALKGLSESLAAKEGAATRSANALNGSTEKDALTEKSYFRGSATAYSDAKFKLDQIISAAERDKARL